jgi:ABC-type cobalamin/Fe3+-siderophores transport system ATPase subunit
MPSREKDETMTTVKGYMNSFAGALAAENLTIGYGERPIIEDLSLCIEKGQITALVGPNGSGKSTLLKAMARLLKPSAGAVLLDGKALHTLSTTQIAQQLAILPQSPSAPTWADCTRIGRTGTLSARGCAAHVEKPRPRRHSRSA